MMSATEGFKVTAVIERDGDWYVAHCPEVPGANGLGQTVEECRSNLIDAINLIFEDRRQESLEVDSTDCVREMIAII
jgi:predicted RNase H-like HicB family nuclease